jgi:hypothetical protein
LSIPEIELPSLEHVSERSKIVEFVGLQHLELADACEGNLPVPPYSPPTEKIAKNDHTFVGVNGDLLLGPSQNNEKFCQKRGDEDREQHDIGKSQIRIQSVGQQFDPGHQAQDDGRRECGDGNPEEEYEESPVASNQTGIALNEKGRPDVSARVSVLPVKDLPVRTIRQETASAAFDRFHNDLLETHGENPSS